MKNFKFMILAAFAAVSFAFASCDKEDSKESKADLTELTAVVDSCQNVLKSATTADYPQAAITAFESTVNAAAKALAGNLNQTAADNMVVQLRAAAKTFAAAAYDAIPEKALTFALSFDEGKGESLKTTGSYNWTAKFEKGPSEIFGTDTQIPQFVDGKVGKALYFDKGAHLEISDFAANMLEGSKLSIAVWVKPAETRAGNYIISYNYWNSWKLNLQTENKPFFTVATEKGVVDMDNETVQSVPNDAWTHVAVTMDLTAGEISFYINGELTKTWTKENKSDALTGTVKAYANSLPLMIGACTTFAEASTWTWAWDKTPENWNFFHGTLDELQVYNVALTAGQVAKLAK